MGVQSVDDKGVPQTDDSPFANSPRQAVSEVYLIASLKLNAPARRWEEKHKIVLITFYKIDYRPRFCCPSSGAKIVVRIEFRSRRRVGVVN